MSSIAEATLGLLLSPGEDYQVHYPDSLRSLPLTIWRGANNSHFGTLVGHNIPILLLIVPSYSTAFQLYTRAPYIYQVHNGLPQPISPFVQLVWFQ